MGQRYVAAPASRYPLPGGHGDDPRATSVGTDLHVLPVVGILGANASGKSKLLHALFYARSVVLASHQAWRPNAPTGREPFRLDPEMAREPSEFAFDSVIGGTRYEYGFALDDYEITAEWLASWPQGRKRRLFDRTGPERTDLRIGPGLRRGYGSRTRTAAEAMRSNSLLVSAGAADNHPLLTAVYEWFQEIGTAHDHNAPGRLESTLRLLDGSGGEAKRRLLRFADLGILDIRSEEREIPPERAGYLTEAFKVLDPDDFPHTEPGG